MAGKSVVPVRVAGVTATLAATGAVIGGGLTAGVAALLGATAGLVGGSATTPSVALMAGVGAALGAVLTPLTAFSLLRRVALGKAVLGTMLGMAIGTGAGYAASAGRVDVAAGSGLVGFMLLALVLRLRSAAVEKEPG